MDIGLTNIPVINIEFHNKEIITGCMRTDRSAICLW